MRDDDLEHLCQLLDNHSSLRPLFGDIPVHAATASAWFSSVLYCGSFTYLRLFSLRLSRQLQHMKKERRNIRPH